MKGFLTAVAVGAFALLGVSQASTSEFIVSGEGEAVVTTDQGTVTVTLTDLYTNPGSIADNMSGFMFTLSTAPTTGSIESSAATEVIVADGGGYTVGSSVAPGWALSLASATTTRDDLAAHADGPAHTIIGDPAGGVGGEYSDANRSIAGNGPHNSFLDQTATWVLDENGVTADTTVASATFQFGTTDGKGRTAGTLVATPEPSTLTLLSCAALLLVLGRLRRRVSGR